MLFHFQSSALISGWNELSFIEKEREKKSLLDFKHFCFDFLAISVFQFFVSLLQCFILLFHGLVMPCIIKLWPEDACSKFWQ